jgi:hypothetical protein
MPDAASEAAAAAAAARAPELVARLRPPTPLGAALAEGSLQLEVRCGGSCA